MMAPTWERDGVRLYHGDALDVLRQLPDGSVDCCVTSPPYWGLRDYGVDGQIGLESTPAQFVSTMVAVFGEVRRVLKESATLWMNLGDCYNAYNGAAGPSSKLSKRQSSERPSLASGFGLKCKSLKPKDLVGIPWRVAFALQSDGWYLRQDIIWCLSGGTVVYARTQKGDMSMTVRDAARLNPATVKLWNGEKWTQVLGWSRTARNADELEIVLRSGERIGCTPTHQFPTGRGLLRASEIVVGDTMKRVGLPQPDEPKRPAHVGDDAAWFAGLYLAEGSMSEDTIQIAGNASQVERYERVKKIAADYGGSATCTIDGNTQSIRVYGKLLVAVVRELVSGRTAKDKCLSPACWRYENNFLGAFLDGYLSGDGHNDEGNDRWRIGFTRNYNLERDLRTLAARLGFHLVLNPVFVEGFGKQWPAFRGEIRFNRSGHHNEKDTAEVVEIRRSRCREVYDVGVEDEPHLFALASGILTHNSKPNPMPESVRDRCTKAHEYVFMFSKSAKYHYDAEAIKEDGTWNPKNTKMPDGLDTGEGAHGAIHRNGREKGKPNDATQTDKQRGHSRRHAGFNERWDAMTRDEQCAGKRNKRSVWTISPEPFPGSHFAVMPTKLVEPCILAGCPEGGVVLDPFVGSGTVPYVATRFGRKAIGIDLNESYLRDIAIPRIESALDAEPLFAATERQEEMWG